MRRRFTLTSKKRLLCCGGALVLLVGALLAVGFTRYYFPSGAYPRLAWLQAALSINQPINQQPLEKLQIVGHRGSGLKNTAGAGYIGNTLEAIRLGFEAKADWIEVDIRRSRDGELMVFHDESVDGTTNRRDEFDHLNDEFQQLTQEQLQALRLNVEPVETIPTLQAAFGEFASPDARFILDIKVKNIRDNLLPLVENHFYHDQIILFGRYDVLEEYKGSGYRLGYTALVSEGWNKYHFAWDHSFILQRCDELGCDYLVLPAVFLRQSLIQEARSNGLGVWAYGIDNERDWRLSAARGVTGLIVDQPANAVKTFRSP